MSAGHKWKPLAPASWPVDLSEPWVLHWMEAYGCDRDEAIARIRQHHAETKVWKNDLYQVTVHPGAEGESAVHLCIRRLDGFPGRDWRHFQQIKNELVGAECEAVEIYPAESRLVDTSNKYHLWCCTDPTYRFPFGWEKRDVAFGDHQEGGLRQRPPMKVARTR